jgi:hypothetical protein
MYQQPHDPHLQNFGELQKGKEKKKKKKKKEKTELLQIFFCPTTSISSVPSEIFIPPASEWVEAERKR